MITLWKNASKHKRSWLVVLAVVLALLLGFLAKVAIELIAYRAVNITGNSTISSKILPSKVWIEQGAYLAILGNCAACHTDRGGAAFAGGKAIQTPFGAVFASNITPDLQHGIGLWSADAFYRAMHHGVNAQGKLLTPAFPYPNTTHISRADSDALYAYFMHGVQPVATPSKAHELSFPFNTQLALAVWRVLFFE